jgi:FKBP-type peptidyl-prolyl cis-trans isomerase
MIPKEDNSSITVRAAIKDINEREIIACTKYDASLEVKTQQEVVVSFISDDGIYRTKTNLKSFENDEPYTFFYLETPDNIEYHQNREYFRVPMVCDCEYKVIVNGEPVTQVVAYSELNERIQSLIEKREAGTYLPNLLAGEAFLAKMAKEPGVMALEQGVLYKVIKTGANDSKHPTLDNTVKIAYKGSTIEGEVFDESEVSEFPLSQLIEGWQIALPKMTVGSKWTIYLPYEVAYGKRGSLPSIKPYSVLIFEIELLDILP